MRKIVSLLFCLSALCASAQVSGYSGSRIFWDTASRRTVFNGGGYARIIELQDGRLMAVCESGGIKIAFSQDKGRPTSPAPTSCKAAATTRRSGARST